MVVRHHTQMGVLMVVRQMAIGRIGAACRHGLGRAELHQDTMHCTVVTMAVAPMWSCMCKCNTSKPVDCTGILAVLPQQHWWGRPQTPDTAMSMHRGLS